jgi:hypothetical protein
MALQYTSGRHRLPGIPDSFEFVPAALGSRNTWPMHRSFAVYLPQISGSPHTPGINHTGIRISKLSVPFFISPF